MSGYTTTGATVIVRHRGAARVDPVHALVLALDRRHGHHRAVVAILPELAVGGMQLFSAEASGFDSDKLAPRIAATARRLCGASTSASPR
jgi:trk system potassium uptake protein